MSETDPNELRAKSFTLGAITVEYTVDAQSQLVEFTCFPTASRHRRVEKRKELGTPETLNLPAKWHPIPARRIDPLVQLHVRGLGGPAGFTGGHTMRNSEATAALKFNSQRITETGQDLTITTILRAEEGFAADHVLRWSKGDDHIRICTIFRNSGDRPLTLEMLSSFSMCGITPFHDSDAPERLRLHRIRSAWSAEGRLDSRLLEDMQLERPWLGCADSSERFGQVGSVPVGRFFPFVAVEDMEANVVWGAQLEIPSSWQLEVYRGGDDVAISGGIADREFGQWWKTIEPGGSFVAPAAILSTVAGDIDDLCHNLTQAHRRSAEQQPSVERDLPIVFNEWCTSWGNPTHDLIVQTAARLAKTATRYLVIDDGWAERPDGGIQQNGDWNVNRQAFPGGLEATCAAVRAKGLIPGVWFEFEVCTRGSRAFDQTEHHLHRDGSVLRVGKRRFWDFRDPRAIEYLTHKVIDLLRNCGFGYLKVDYNDTIGLGCDGAESLGEGLRQHVLAVQEFFAEIRRELPELVIEVCSSGGHRLDSSWLACGAIGSFSDAHETVEIPIIAANLHRVMLPRQSLVWAVLRREDSLARLGYSLAATFLGRMCLSGDFNQLSAEQLRVVNAAQQFYQHAAPIIRDGRTRRFGEWSASYRHPRGWQALRRISADNRQILIVLHTFADPPAMPLYLPLPPGRWKVLRAFNLNEDIDLSEGMVRFPRLDAFAGQAVLLTGVEDAA
jgi:alpha-galactosidase